MDEMKRDLRILYKRSGGGKMTCLAIKPKHFSPDNAGRDMDDYGRFVLTESFKDPNGSRRWVTANLLFSEAKMVARRLHEAEKDFLFGEKTASSEDASSGTNRPAFHTKVFLKPFVGLSPGEYLVAHPDDVEQLKQTGLLLKRNVEKDPNGKYAESNRRQMDALRDAIRMAQNGEIPTEASSVSGAVAILKTPPKNKMQKNAEGKNLVYSVTIGYHRDSGIVDLTIENCYAAVIQHEGRGQTFDLQNASDRKRLMFNMDLGTACAFFDAAAEYTARYEQYMFAHIFEAVKAEEDRERDAWKQSQGARDSYTSGNRNDNQRPYRENYDSMNRSSREQEAYYPQGQQQSWDTGWSNPRPAYRVN